MMLLAYIHYRLVAEVQNALSLAPPPPKAFFIFTLWRVISYRKNSLSFLSFPAFFMVQFHCYTSDVSVSTAHALFYTCVR
jgi:hypothetical protein